MVLFSIIRFHDQRTKRRRKDGPSYMFGVFMPLWMTCALYSQRMASMEALKKRKVRVAFIFYFTRLVCWILPSPLGTIDAAKVRVTQQFHFLIPATMIPRFWTIQILKLANIARSSRSLPIWAPSSNTPAPPTSKRNSTSDSKKRIRSSTLS